MKSARFSLLLLAALAGCAYYNGMYNANRLARQAEKAEREGRTFDATSLWGQAGVKADTVLARHRSSKWFDDALLIRGKSYQRLGDCASAVTTLRRLLASSTDSALVEEGSFLLARCYQTLGNTEQASEAFLRLVGSRNPERRREALYQHGHSLIVGGHYAEALEQLGNTDHPRAAGERAAALAGLGRTEEAVRIADSLLVADDTAASWSLLLGLLGRSDPLAASQILTRLGQVPRISQELIAGLLLEDAARLAPTHPDLARNRLSEALRIAPSSLVADRARLAMLRLHMAAITEIDSLALIQQELPDVQQVGGSNGIVAARYDRIALIIRDLADSVAQGAVGPDMRLFLAAELARDSLEMGRLAHAIFSRVIRDYPASPYVPKALLALVALDPSLTDSTRTVLTRLYPSSPYLLAWEGQASPEFSSLEDSLARFVSRLHRPVRTNTPGRPAARPSSGLPQN